MDQVAKFVSAQIEHEFQLRLGADFSESDNLFEIIDSLGVLKFVRVFQAINLKYQMSLNPEVFLTNQKLTFKEICCRVREKI